jgi:hypothetical protein
MDNRLIDRISRKQLRLGGEGARRKQLSSAARELSMTEVRPTTG